LEAVQVPCCIRAAWPDAALKMLLREWELKWDDYMEGHFKMIYYIHKTFNVNEMRDIAKQVWCE